MTVVAGAPTRLPMTVTRRGTPTAPPETPIRLIGIDIDGTLLDSRGRLPERNRRAVRAAVERGVHVVLVTGRAYHHAMPVARKLHGIPTPDPGPDPPAGCDSDRAAGACDGTLIVSNGALTKRTDGATLLRRLLPRATARAIVAAMRPRHAGVAVIFDRPGARQYVHEGIDWSHPNRAWYYERNRAYMTCAERIETALTDDPVQVGFTGSVAQMRALRTALLALPAARRITPMLTEYAARDFSLLDIIARGCSKGSALEAWARRLALDPAEVMAVGDNLNDLEMLEFAGRPVVMGNAVAELKARGWPLTAHHDACGLAAAIEATISTPCLTRPPRP